MAGRADFEERHALNKATVSIDDALYDEFDLRYILQRARSRGWDQLIDWLEERNHHDARLPSVRAQAMAREIKRLRAHGEPFTNDPHIVCRMIRKVR